MFSEELIYYDIRCERCQLIIGRAGHHGASDPSNDEFICIRCYQKYVVKEEVD